MSGNRIQALINEKSSSSSPLQKRPKQVDQELSSPTPSMMFGDDRASTPNHNAEEIAQMMAEEQR